MVPGKPKRGPGGVYGLSAQFDQGFANLILDLILDLTELLLARFGCVDVGPGEPCDARLQPRQASNQIMIMGSGYEHA